MFISSCSVTAKHIKRIYTNIIYYYRVMVLDKIAGKYIATVFLRKHARNRSIEESEKVE